MDRSDLANRMKDYEKRNRYYLQRRMPVIIRLDMRAGHTFTKGFKRPFDEVFMKSMQETAKYLCENIQNTKIAYTQSDEITLVLIDYEKLNTDAFFDYRVDKMCSIAASMATMAFNRFFEINTLTERLKNDVEHDYALGKAYKDALYKGAMFDARVFNIPKEDVTNNFYWRQLDCSRNSIQMVGQANFSHKELQNKSCIDIQEMLLQKDIDWNDFPAYQKRGTCVVKNKYISRDYYVAFTQKEYKEYSLHDSSKSENEWIIDKDIPIFKGEGREYIEKLINF
jgi:tRNA(His) 5'-end guanylyltransferase